MCESLQNSQVWHRHNLFAGMSCFEGLFSCPEASSVLVHNFCIYHIDPPGHEVRSQSSLIVGLEWPEMQLLIVTLSVSINYASVKVLFSQFFITTQTLSLIVSCAICQIGAPESAPKHSSLSVDDLADQVAEVLDYFGYATCMHGSVCFPRLFIVRDIIRSIIE